MHGQTRNAIVRRWKSGYKVWAIAAEMKLTADQVIDVLVDQGTIQMSSIELIIRNRT